MHVQFPLHPGGATRAWIVDGERHPVCEKHFREFDEGNHRVVLAKEGEKCEWCRYIDHMNKIG